MGATYLADLLDTLVQEALIGLDDTRTGHPEPSRVYVSHSAPAVDVCTDDGLLVAYLYREPHLHPRSNARLGSGCMVTATAECVVEVWRCHPTLADDGTPPTVTALDDAAQALLVDLWCLQTHLQHEWLQGTLTAGQPCNLIEWGVATPLGPQGAAAGWRVPLTYTLSDPAPAGLAS